jgi:ammonia channel protein AmtB
MFGVLGFLPGYIVAKILNSVGMLRIPKEVELLGLDFATNQDETRAAEEVKKAEKSLV